MADSNVTILQAEDWVTPLSVVDSNAAAVNVTSWTWKAQLRRVSGGTLLVDMAVAETDPAGGIVTLSMTDVQTAALKAGTYLWGVVARDTSGIDRQLVRGTATVVDTAPRIT